MYVTEICKFLQRSKQKAIGFLRLRGFIDNLRETPGRLPSKYFYLPAFGILPFLLPPASQRALSMRFLKRSQ